MSYCHVICNIVVPENVSIVMILVVYDKLFVNHNNSNMLYSNSCENSYVVVAILKLAAIFDFFNWPHS